MGIKNELAREERENGGSGKRERERERESTELETHYGCSAPVVRRTVGQSDSVGS